MRPYIHPVRSNHGTRYKAEIKPSRVYIGTFDTPDLALAACEEFIATGSKPAPTKRGPRGPQKAKRQSSVRRPAPPAHLRDTCTPASENRVEMMRRIYRSCY